MTRRDEKLPGRGFEQPGGLYLSKPDFEPGVPSRNTLSCAPASSNSDCVKPADVLPASAPRPQPNGHPQGEQPTGYDSRNTQAAGRFCCDTIETSHASDAISVGGGACIHEVTSKPDRTIAPASRIYPDPTGCFFAMHARERYWTDPVTGQHFHITVYSRVC